MTNLLCNLIKLLCCVLKIIFNTGYQTFNSFLQQFSCCNYCCGLIFKVDKQIKKCKTEKCETNCIEQTIRFCCCIPFHMQLCGVCDSCELAWKSFCDSFELALKSICGINIFPFLSSIIQLFQIIIYCFNVLQIIKRLDQHVKKNIFGENLYF